MKKSQIAILAAAGFIVVIMLIVIGLGRLAVGKALDSGFSDVASNWSSTGADASKSLDLDGFDSIVVEGAWTVRISRSDDFTTEIRYPSDLEDIVQVRIRGNQLVLGTHDWHGRSRGDLIAEISMPTLSEIRIEGAADASFTGFEEEVLDVIIDGAANVEGYNTRVDKLSVNLNGVGKVDLNGVESVNARVELEGAGEIRLDMNGGVLEGSLDGMGSIIYSGVVTEEKIRIEGLGRVRSE